VPVELTAVYQVALGDTIQNLRSAAAGEMEEWSKIYADFAKTAQQEGFPDVAAMFKIIITIEKRHETRFRKLAENMAENRVFSKEAPASWKCIKCGYVHEGLSAPEICPGCKHPQAYFELFTERY
jgi:rubrerythrin